MNYREYYEFFLETSEVLDELMLEIRDFEIDYRDGEFETDRDEMLARAANVLRLAKEVIKSIQDGTT